MVILHNLLQENNLFVFFNSKSQEEKIEDEGKESFLEIFIYFQLLSMFCRCKAAKVVRYGIAVLWEAKKALLFYLVSGFLWAFNEIPLLDSSEKFKFTRNPLKGLWDFFYAWGHKSCEFAIFFIAEYILLAGCRMDEGKHKTLSKDCPFIRYFYFDNHSYGSWGVIQSTSNPAGSSCRSSS